MTFQFKIQIKDITGPPVWRRVLVPAQFSFLRFHKVIQASFGWENYHLFQFSPNGYTAEVLIEIPFEDDNLFGPVQKKLHAGNTKLSEIFSEPKQKFIYIYDFGDDWIHQLTLETITEDKLLRAACTDGKGACPPEDCGGAPGYSYLKEILANSKHPEHKGMKEWLGLAPKEKWDAETFDLETTMKLVSKI
jgi:hypothetical protein